MAFKNYATEAAWSKLIKKLEMFNRGDDITFAWVGEHTGIENARYIEGRLRTHFSKRMIEITRRSDHWHLLTNEEQLEKIDGRVRHTRREKARAHRANTGLDREALSTVGRQRADHQQRYLVEQLKIDAAHERERKAILGAPTPQPRLKK